MKNYVLTSIHLSFILVQIELLISTHSVQNQLHDELKNSSEIDTALSDINRVHSAALKDSYHYEVLTSKAAPKMQTRSVMMRAMMDWYSEIIGDKTELDTRTKL